MYGGVKVTSEGIKELPDCAVEGCKNKGFVGLNGRWVCGECSAKAQKLSSDALFEKLKKD